ncbi:MAG: flagellar biosynthesis anti-sigma factor FlgM [Bdellovibrionales bacterium]|nr:flagellar biosynthesis anti-sigma factor FlgM [Bdellovibrionales bacterium]
MKISRGASHALTQQAQADNNKSVKGKGIKGMATKSSPVSSAPVSLSSKAQQMKKATELAKADNVDEKKVAYFQNLIDSGKYQMDSAKIADKLVDDHMKMPS